MQECGLELLQHPKEKAVGILRGLGAYSTGKNSAALKNAPIEFIAIFTDSIPNLLEGTRICLCRCLFFAARAILENSVHAAIERVSPFLDCISKTLPVRFALAVRVCGNTPGKQKNAEYCGKNKKNILPCIPQISHARAPQKMP